MHDASNNNSSSFKDVHFQILNILLTEWIECNELTVLPQDPVQKSNVAIEIRLWHISANFSGTNLSFK